MRFQKFMWHNMMRLTKSQKVSVLHYFPIFFFYAKSRLHCDFSLNYIKKKKNVISIMMFYN